MGPAPAWLITDDVDHVEVELGNLKSGKEAEVFLIERSFGDRSCLLAHKRYRPRSVSHKGELEALGFEHGSSFVHDGAYRQGRKIANSRDRRAVARMTKYGKTVVASSWNGHELEMMRRAWDAGVSVPYPVGERGDGMLMQFLGDLDGAAPRLSDARLGRDDLAGAFAQLTRNLRILVGAGYVHADLSAFNLLWWQETVWLIDFPQAVDLTASDRAFDFLFRDVDNVCRWFGRHGLAVDTASLYDELVAVASRT